MNLFRKTVRKGEKDMKKITEKRITSASNFQDIRNKALISLKEAAEILCLKYHTARAIIYNEPSLGYVKFTSKKRMWVKDDILDFKQRRYVQAQTV